jgi:hypothetical protein
LSAPGSALGSGVLDRFAGVTDSVVGMAAGVEREAPGATAWVVEEELTAAVTLGITGASSRAVDVSKEPLFSDLTV